MATPGDPLGGDDAGCIPPTAAVGKCEDGVQKALTRYIQTVIKCHIKAQGSGNGEFAQPYGVAVDADGNMFVAAITNDRVQKFACP